MTERSAERRVRQETGWLAGGPLLSVTTIRHTTDTHHRHIPLHFSHNERAPVQISLQLVLELLKKFPVYFVSQPLHVSGIFVAHHRGYTHTVYIQQLAVTVLFS